MLNYVDILYVLYVEYASKYLCAYWYESILINLPIPTTCWWKALGVFPFQTPEPKANKNEQPPTGLTGWCFRDPAITWDANETLQYRDRSYPTRGFLPGCLNHLNGWLQMFMSLELRMDQGKYTNIHMTTASRRPHLASRKFDLLVYWLPQDGNSCHMPIICHTWFKIQNHSCTEPLRFCQASLTPIRGNPTDLHQK